MRRFKSILVSVSAETPLVDKLQSAAELARRNEASLKLIGIQEPEGSWRRLLQLADVDLPRLHTDTRREELLEHARQLDVPDVEVEVADGVPHVEIIRRVLRDGHDLVVAAPDEPGRTVFSGAATTMHLLRKCPVPVWVHSAGAAERKGIAVAVGPFGPERRADGLHRTLLELASSLATRRGEPLHVLHAWFLYGERSMRRGTRSPFSETEVDRMLHSAERSARTDVALLLERLGIADDAAQIHLGKGEPGDVIPRLTEELRPSTLVMGTVARSGLDGVLIGNTAEKILGRIGTSVLATKPEGFESPVAIS